MVFLRSLPVLVLGVAACATSPSAPATPYVPAGVFGVYLDNDTGAINQSSWAFASSENTRGNPVDAARALIALEYLPGELRENPRWVGMDAATKFHMGQARDELRRIIGIRPDAPPQMVVNALLRLSAGLQFGDQAGVAQALASPVFARPPEQTLQSLSNLPYDRTANLATAFAEAQARSGGG